MLETPGGKLRGSYWAQLKSPESSNDSRFERKEYCWCHWGFVKFVMYNYCIKLTVAFSREKCSIDTGICFISFGVCDAK
jgi:hypothetical protein